MKLLVIGDVHGCYHTLRTMVEKHWKPGEQILIQVGDLINKGKHSGLCLQYWRELEQEYGEKVIMLRGNHEQILINHINSSSTDSTAIKLMENLQEEGQDIYDTVEWLSATRLKYETEGLIITHAGIAKNSKDPFNPASPSGVLYNRSALKCLSKQQILGHSIVEGHKPVFNTKENAWYLDTGAWVKKYLSALLIEEDGSEPLILREQRVKPD